MRTPKLTTVRPLSAGGGIGNGHAEGIWVGVDPARWVCSNRRRGAPLAVRIGACPIPCRAHAPAAQRDRHHDRHERHQGRVAGAGDRGVQQVGREDVRRAPDRRADDPGELARPDGEEDRRRRAAAHPLEPRRHQLGRTGQPTAQGAGQSAGGERAVPAHRLRRHRLRHVAADGRGAGLAGQTDRLEDRLSSWPATRRAGRSTVTRSGASSSSAMRTPSSQRPASACWRRWPMRRRARPQG